MQKLRQGNQKAPGHLRMQKLRRAFLPPVRKQAHLVQNLFFRQLEEGIKTCIFA